MPATSTRRREGLERHPGGLTPRVAGYAQPMSLEEFTVQSAQRAADAGKLATWVDDFLASDGSDNAVLGEQLREAYPIWFGPIDIRFDQLHRLAGPPDQPTLERLDDDDVETVEAMEESIDDGWTPPPFVATWQEDHLVLEDGNHRVEGLRRSGHDRHPCIVGVTSDAERARAEAAIAEGGAR